MKARQPGLNSTMAAWGLALFCLLAPSPARAWGNRAHEMINAAAIHDLPQPLRSWFSRHQFELVENASLPDKLARGDALKERHHFINADAYGPFPFHALRMRFVTERLGPSRTELRNGDVIWQIDIFERRLAADFSGREKQRELHDEVFLAHYAADLTQPLHTVANFDGRRTGERGIHKAFETGVVDFYAARLRLHPAPAVQFNDVRAAIFSELLRSYQEAPAIFMADREVRKRWRPGDDAYVPALAARLGSLTQSRLNDAAGFVASLWYTAWRMAGSPSPQILDATPD